MTVSEEEIRAGFAAMRDEEEAAVPRFVVPGPAVRGQPRLKWAVAVAAALVVVVWVASRMGREPAPTLDLSRVVWIAPTDFLLETPGRDLLRRLPDLGPITLFEAGRKRT